MLNAFGKQTHAPAVSTTWTCDWCERMLVVRGAWGGSAGGGEDYIPAGWTILYIEPNYTATTARASGKNPPQRICDACTAALGTFVEARMHAQASEPEPKRRAFRFEKAEPQVDEEDTEWLEAYPDGHEGNGLFA